MPDPGQHLAELEVWRDLYARYLVAADPDEEARLRVELDERMSAASDALDFAAYSVAAQDGPVMEYGLVRAFPIFDRHHKQMPRPDVEGRRLGVIGTREPPQSPGEALLETIEHAIDYLGQQAADA